MANLTSNVSLNSSILTASPTKCCIPGCKTAPLNPHIALYKVMRNWIDPIKKYIAKTTCSQLEINKYWQNRRPYKICARHVKLLGIRVGSVTESVYFPYLKISVGYKPQKELSKNEVYSSEAISVGAEITLPIKDIAPLVNTRNREIKRKLSNHLLEHSYAITREYLEEITKENERLAEENRRWRMLKAPLRVLGGPFSDLLRNEAMLSFYTGFTTIQNLKEFLTLIRPYYDEVPKWGNPRKKSEWLDFENQVLLVLTRLRHGFLQNDIAYRYNIPPNVVSKVWQFWMNLLYSCLVDISLKLNGQEQNFHQVILECTETLFAEPYPKEVKEDYLQVYARTKGLLEVSSKGLICSISLLYPGNLTDQQLLQRYRLSRQNFITDGIKNIKKGSDNSVPGDDNGELLQKHMSKIVFYIKSFKILKGTFPNPMFDLTDLNQMWMACCFLTNFINKPSTFKSS